MGLLGIGPETKANLGGQLVGAALPIGTGISGLYSRLGRAAEEIPHANTATAIKKFLSRRATNEEMETTGVNALLAGKKPDESVAPELIKRHLADNAIKLETKTLGGLSREPSTPPAIGDTSNESWQAYSDSLSQPIHQNPQTKYSKYTLPGGQNYRESLITIPQKREMKPGSGNGGTIPPYLGWEDVKFQSNHWDDPNIIVHSRYNERRLPDETLGMLDTTVPSDTNNPVFVDMDKGNFMRQGPKGRFLEEVQSDWHEQGRDQGYRDPAKRAAAEQTHQQAKKEYEDATDHLRQLVVASGHPRAGNFGALGVEQAAKARVSVTNDPVLREALQRHAAAMDNLGAADRTWNDAHSGSHVPDAPFKEKWSDLALKQHLLDVADRPDLHWLGWTPGSVQNERYDLSKRVSRIAFDHDATSNVGALTAWGPDGQQVMSKEIGSPEQLVEHLGKDAASRLMSQPPKPYQGYMGLDNGSAPTHSYELTGQDLQIGGQGMTDFYDRQLPDKMNKLLKPFGGKVEHADMPLGSKPPTLTPYFDQGTRNMMVGQSGVRGGEFEVASEYPRRHPNDVRRFSRQTAGDALLALVQQTNPSATKIPTLKMPFVRLTPDMKQQIKEKGFPLLAALLARQQIAQPEEPHADPNQR